MEEVSLLSLLYWVGTEGVDGVETLLPQKAHLVVKLAGSVTVVVAVSLLVSDAKDGDLVQVSK